MHYPTRLYRLPDGLRLIHVQAPGHQTAYYNLDVRAGHADERLDRRECAHLIEHVVMARLAESLRAKAAVQYVVNAHKINASTTSAFTSFYGSCHRRHLPRVLRELAASLDVSGAPAAVIETERERVIDERRRASRSHHANHSARWLSAHNGHDPRHRPMDAAAKADQARGLTQDDLVAFQRAHYAADRAILTVVGDLAKSDLTAINKAFTWPARNGSKAAAPMAPPRPGTRHVAGSKGRAIVSLTWVGPHLTRTETYALSVLRRRYDRFLTLGLERDFKLYTSDVSLVFRPLFSSMEIDANVDAKDVPRLARRLRTETARFLRQMTEDEWQQAMYDSGINNALADDAPVTVGEQNASLMRTWGKLDVAKDDRTMRRRLTLALARRVINKVTAQPPIVVITYEDAPWPGTKATAA